MREPGIFKTRKLKLLHVNIDEVTSKIFTKHHLSHSTDKRSDEINQTDMKSNISLIHTPNMRLSFGEMTVKYEIFQPQIMPKNWTKFSQKFRHEILV